MWVGWGTVVVSAIVFVLIGSAYLSVGPEISLTFDFAVSVFHATWMGTAFSIMILIPMMIVYVAIYAVIRKHVVSIRAAILITAAVSALAGMILIGICLGLAAGNIGGFVMAILPWSLVPMSIAPCITWFVFKPEQFAGGK